MEIKQIGETYSVFEETDDPMENMRRRNKVFILFLCSFSILALIAWMIIDTAPSKYTGKELYYEIEDEQISTLYKYTEYADIFMVREEKDYSDKDMKVKYVVIFYNTKIPLKDINTYQIKLKELGYEKITYDGNELYVLNNEMNSKFKYVYIGETQIKYGVCVSGTYENVLK